MQLTRRERSTLQALATRGGRKRLEFCRCEGVRSVRELLQRHPDAVVLVAATQRGLTALGRDVPESKLRECSEEEFNNLSATVNSQGVMALAVPAPAAEDAPEGDFIFALDRIADPGNFGTIARTCLAVGGRELWFTAGTVDPWCDKALRAGMGAQFSLNWRVFPTLTELKECAAKYGFGNFFIADPHDGEICFDAPDLYRKSVIVIGNEANGVTEVPPGSRQVIIPMPGNFESLNAAQAATVLLVEYTRRSREHRKQ